MKDPETSKQAGERVTEMRASSQARVKNMFVLYGDLHDKALTTYLHDAERSAGLKPMSPSGVRSRRSELSKPNMDRLDEIVMERHQREPLLYPETSFDALDGKAQSDVRQQLRGEGFRSPLWDTGRRENVDGRNVIVWGLAR